MPNSANQQPRHSLCVWLNVSHCICKPVRMPSFRNGYEFTMRTRFWVEPPPSSPKNVRPCTFLGYKFAGANLLLLGTTDIPVRSETARSLAEIKRRHATEYTSCTFCGYEFSLMSKLVTDLLPRHPWRFCYVEHLLQKRHGCRWLYQKRCFGGTETRHQKCTWMYTFDDATTQMYPSSAFGNSLLRSLPPPCTLLNDEICA